MEDNHRSVVFSVSGKPLGTFLVAIANGVTKRNNLAHGLIDLYVRIKVKFYTNC